MSQACHGNASRLRQSQQTRGVLLQVVRGAQLVREPAGGHDEQRARLQGIRSHTVFN